ncbi:asparagine--tRNA ligase [Metamycoplasma hominis]|uniref:asparagine--tRNA ligase n=1 Tax=Metamycoplasma hominis TaxID=2098 RepID=UPI00036D8F6F|nr:asparagine--tRNA ligase [Metamycoplasma hominis]AIU34237.1 asparaginyl-tRNA synthetase [Metamycoplasma hominis ATCC 27545]MBD3898816.1 asparagine--tRNA ligase [Metamycoplasma hominis]QKX37395.1 asparagine--tRNA ligase [Metamycoplasma hominis]QKX40170.1 asparagine--tRNA ligase [Metamycoplasma hominis]RCJ00079.1 asparagine--tRNA ligase [Metamycoplasma hominis]
MNIKQLYKQISQLQENVELTIEGWIISNRGNDKIRFITINDGSTIANMQLVVKGELASKKEISEIAMGSAVSVIGKLHLTPEAMQPFELSVSKFLYINNPQEDFPIQKKETSLDFLREIPQLRHRTSLFRAIMLIRNSLMFEIHKYFQSKGFLNLSSPIITSNDGEGAGETLLVDDESKDYFFKQKAFLGVTGQLHAESYAEGFKKVYTFGPTFRAENSHTSRHLAEFWMMEPEVAFCDLKGIIEITDDMLKNVIANTLKNYPEEMKYLDSLQNNKLIESLNNFINKKLTIIEYKDVVENLKNYVDKFEEKDIFFGMDLASEHEKFLAENIIKGPVAVINYPKDIKAFYMYQNDDGKTVAAFDLLVPGIGELVGGSQRENRYQKLVDRINELKITQETLQWYLDLRRFGYAPSSGFGLGFERLVMYVTGTSNIRDVIPFPRVAGSIKM